jgi:hypothetical protein
MRALLLHFFIFAFIMFCFSFGSPLLAQSALDSLRIISLQPEANQANASASTSVSITFDRPAPIGDFSVDSFVLYGERAGFIPSTVSFSSDSLTLTLAPDSPLIYGDRMTAILLKQPSSPSPLLQNGYIWEFDVAPGDGSKSFVTSTYSSNLRLSSIVSADLNRDGLIDLAFTGSNGADDILRLAYMTSGGIVFGDSIVLPDRVRPLYTADLNRDGYPDFVMLHRGMTKYGLPPRISICHLNADGSLRLEETFTIENTISGRAEPRSAIINDINADGFLDIIVQIKQDINPKSAFVYFNDGTGHFFPNSSSAPWFDSIRNAESIFDRDLNETGFIDVGIGHTGSLATVALHLNDGDGSYTESSERIVMFNRDLENVKSLDFTGDLKPDVVLADFSGSEILIYDWMDTTLNDGGLPVPVFNSTPRIFPTVQSPNWFDYADVDNDGDFDLAVTGSYQNNLQIMLNDNGDFSETLEIPIPSFPGNFTVGDINGDTGLDIIVADTSGLITVLYNNVANYSAPDPPELLRPANSSFIANSSPNFEWRVPQDANSQDPLHFRVRISSSDGADVIYDSRFNVDMFSPRPPVIQGVGSIEFTLPDALLDGEYRWSVQAWDGLFLSESSEEWQFTIDATSPILKQLTFPTADFAGKWFAIVGASSILAEITFDEMNPNTALLNTNGLGGPFAFSDLPAGIGVSAQLDFLPDPSPDGEYKVSVELMDKSAGSDTISGVVGVDRTPPSGALASSLEDTSSALSFPVSWSGGTDGNGSGLSGSFRVQFRKDNGPWTLWIAKTQRSDSLFSGVHNSFYEFEAAAFDNVGFIEAFNNVPEKGIFVDKYSDDKIAPHAPLNLRANGDNPSPWQKSTNFTVRWDLPADESGIKNSFWKRGVPPTSNQGFEDSDGPRGPAEIVLEKEGVTPFYVWLSDSAGNADYHNAGLVNLRRDSTLPIIHDLSIEGTLISPVVVQGVPWFNSQADKYFTARVDYSEIYAEKGVLTTDGLSDSLVNMDTDLAKGENVTTLFSFTIQNPADRVYTLKSIVIDSAANKASKSSPLGLDGHPPQNSLASAPAISDTEVFLVSWSAGNDGSGSGIVEYDLYYKVNDNSWKFWFSTDSVGSEVFSGQNGFEYRFESVAKDYVGLSEERASGGEATVLVDLSANDKEAPPPPIDLKANGNSPESAWTTNSNFQVTWRKPTDLSGVVASYWKLGDPPVSNTDTTGTGPAEGTMSVRMAETGKKWLYLWLIDAKGNVDFNNADSVLLRFDIILPKIVSSQFLDAGYGDNWYNPSGTDSAHFQVTYHEQFLQRIRLSSNDLGYDIVKTNVSSGIGIRQDFALEIANRQNGSGEIVIALTDSAGNTSQAVDTLRLDSEPPSGSLASSPAAAGATSFQVSWSTGNDNGVGVSDTFDVFVKVDEQGWLPWKTNIIGRTALFTDGQDKHTYHFESVSRDWLGNVENRTYAYETSTYVDVALSDSLAPGAPVDLRANGGNPSPWRKTNEFEITWNSPQDPTGTPRGWYKVGEAPTNANDTTGSFVGDPPIVVRATKENGQRLFVWLQDGADNVDYRNSSAVNLRFDATLPKIDSLALDATYGNRWYNPSVPPHKAVFDIYFSERNPSIAHFEPTSLFAPDSLQLRAGLDSASFEMDFEGLGDADVSLKVLITDSAGNAAEDAVLLSLDRTPPRNTVAQSPDTTKPGEFTISWDTSQAEENGAGLSGIFDVRLQVDNGPWELWKARYNSTVAAYSGEEGHKYSFEVAAYDNVGNKEEFQNRAETTTWIVTQFVDTTPPGVPTNLKVNGSQESEWSNDSQFTINWTQPADPSGIEKVFYKFDGPPTSTSDFDGESAGTPPINIELQEDGIRDVYLWLQDGAGNSAFTNYGYLVLKFDGTPPEISRSIVANAVYDDKWLNPDSTESAQIRITYNEFFVDSLLLFFAGTKADVEMTELTSGEAQQVDAILALQDVGDGFYPIAVVMQDSAGNSSTDSMFVGLDSAPPQGAVASSPEQSITGKFTIGWAGEGAGADDGSGLSGDYDLRMRIGNGQWFEVLSRENTSSYTYVGAHDNRFYFEVAAWDNAGNRELFTGEPETTTLVDTAFIDQTPPEAPIELVVAGKNPSPWQNNSEFLITWQNPVDPSGIASAFYKLGAPPQTVKDFTDSVVVENGLGSISVVVSEENNQTVYIWLKDGRGNVNYESASSILLRYDATPPILLSISPVDPAYGNNWYNQKESREIFFDIAFEETHPDSIVLRNDLIATTVTELVSSGHDIDSIRVGIDVGKSFDGVHWFYATLFDSAGTESTTDSIEIIFDSEPPNVTLSPPDSVMDEGTSLAITATANDANELQFIDLVYWQGGQRQRQTTPMMLLGDSTYVADIPGDVLTSRGVEYIIQASDGPNINRYPLTTENSKPFVLRVRVEGEAGRGLVMPQPLPHGVEENAYRLVSFPLEMMQRAPSEILEPVLGAYDIKNWRFFYWNTLSTIFSEYDDIESIYDGIGYWIITSNQDARLQTGTGLSVNTVTPYVVVLKKGWNDIGLPFNFSVDWNDIISASAVDTQNVQGPHGYEGRWKYPFENKTLQPWSGYSVYSDVDDISLVIPALESQPVLEKNQPFVSRGDLDWAFEIKAVNGLAVDGANYFGCTKSATMEWDYGLDFVEAPEIGAYVSLYFPHEDWQLAAERYTSDFRPRQKGHVWDFEVATRNVDGDIRLSFRPIVPIPKSLQLHLLDTAANMKIDLVSDSVYTFQLSDTQLYRQFKIYAGDAEFMQQHEEELPEQPTDYELVQNFPNPFNGSTIISYQLENGADVNLAVYNLLAQKVKQLQQGWQESGFYQVRWDARDDQNVELGTGVYILRLETSNFTSTRKMIFMR